MRRTLRRLAWFVVCALALLVGCVIALLIFVDTDPGRRLIHAEARDALLERFPGGVTIGELGGSVYDELVLRDVVISDVEGKPAITVKTLRARVSLSPLARKTARVDRVVAEDVEIILGQAQLTRPRAPPGEVAEPSSWTVELPDVTVHRARIAIATGDATYTIEGAELSAQLAMPAGRPLAGAVRASGTWAERALPFELAGQISLGDTVAMPVAFAAAGAPDRPRIRIRAHDLVLDPARPSGTVHAEIPRASIGQIVPDATLPDDARLSVVASPRGSGIHVDVYGALGRAQLRGAIQGEIASRRAAVYLAASSLDVAALSGGKLRAIGDAALALEVDATRIRGIVGLRGLVEDLPLSNATVFVDTGWGADRNTALVTALATTAGDARIAATAELPWQTRLTPAVDVTRARIDARGKDLAKATGDRVLATSRDDVVANVALTKPGRAWPVADLAFAGTANGTRLVYDTDVVVGRAAARFDGTVAGERVTAKGHADLVGVVNDGTPLGRAGIDGRLLDDQQRIALTMKARPDAADVDIYATAVVTPGDTIEVAIGKHRIVPRSGTPWTGAGGRITITDERTEVRGLATSNGSGRLALRADVVKPTDTLAVELDATAVEAAAFDATYRGTASGKLALTRRRTRWDGSGTFTVTGLALEPDAPTVDGTAKLAVAGRDARLDLTAASEGIGSGRFGLEVQAPVDLVDVDAWRRLDRGAIRRATLRVDKLDLAALSPTGGTIAGELQLAGQDTKGTLEVDGVETPLGTAKGQIVITPLGDNPFAAWTATIPGVGTADVGVQIALPKRPFDPVAWKQHGRRVIPSLSVSIDDVVVDPSKLAKLGVDAPYRGRLDVKLAASGSAGIAKLDIDVRGVQGGTLVQPVDAQLHVETGPGGTTAYACIDRAAAGTSPLDCAQPGDGKAPKLVELRDVALPIAFDRWLAAPKAALVAPLAGTLVVPAQQAAPVLAIFGRTDFIGGTLDGKVAIAGTLQKPTANGQLAMHDVRIVSWIPGRMVPTLNEVLLKLRWDGVAIDNELSIQEASGGTLVAYVKGRPDRLDELVTGYTAISLDIAPIAAFLPGDVSAATGKLGGSGLITGVDPAKMKIKGNLYLTQASAPLTPVLGTLRDGYVRVEAYADKGIELVARGILGTCRDPNKPKCTENVRLTGKAPHDLSRFEGNLTVTQVAPIGEIEPLIDGKARIVLHRTGRKWDGDIWVSDARVFVPPAQGLDLLDEELPEDVFDAEQVVATRARVRAPTKTWLTAEIHLRPTPITVEEYGVLASVRSKNLRLLVGDTIGLDGKIALDYGTANDIFGRQYKLEPTDIVTFEGTTEPEVDLRMTRQFPTMTLEVRVKGKPSDPGFPQLVFSDDRGRYGQGELLAFFLGGDPSGAASTQASAAGIGVGSSLLLQPITRRLKKVLPRQLRLDVIKCEPGAGATGTTCTFGRTFRDGKAQVSYRTRTQVRPNENSSEGQAQYYWTPEWYTEAVGGNANVWGLDLLWRRRW